jgi:hypothetical protein
MSAIGDADLLAAVRRALLDALDALDAHADALVLIGAQAIFLHTGAVRLAIAETTKDTDLAIDIRFLRDRPLLDEALSAAGFHRERRASQPGSWLSSRAVPVDLMVPASMVSSAGRRGARIPPHGKHVARRAAGLEASMVDRSLMTVAALEPADDRARTLNVAGPAALLVAKLHKLGERRLTPDRLVDKDAHDVYRLLVAVPTADLVDALGSEMAGRAEAGVGSPDVVAASVALLAGDLLDAIKRRS